MVRVGHRSFVHRLFHNIRSFVTLFFRSLFAKPTKSPPQYLYRGGAGGSHGLPPKPRPPAAPRNNVRSFSDLPPSASHAACLPGGGGG
jgi:hypothetical protein